MPLLQVSSLRAGYGADEILFGVQMHAELGEIVTIVGPNGCGKSTLLKSIVGLVPRVQGQLQLDGQDLSGWGTERRAAAGLGYLPQLAGVFAPMTVHENLLLGGWGLPRALRRQRLEQQLQTFGILARLLKRQAGSLSGGERQVVGLAAALMREPRLLLLDEPSAGLSPIAAQEIFGHIERLRTLARGIVIVEQNVRLALSISDRGYVLAAGANVFDGRSQDIVANEEVRAAYLGH